MKQTSLATRLCVGALALTWQLVMARDGPDRAQTMTKANPSSGLHAKASSFAPRAHSKRHVYGAPIQGPIVGKRKPAAHKDLHTVSPTAVSPTAVSPTAVSPAAVSPAADK